LAKARITTEAKARITTEQRIGTDYKSAPATASSPQANPRQLSQTSTFASSAKPNPRQRDHPLCELAEGKSAPATRSELTPLQGGRGAKRLTFSGIRLYKKNSPEVNQHSSGEQVVSGLGIQRFRKNLRQSREMQR
jgi:hypothetical protein